MKTKKIVSLILALVMSLALCVPAFAATPANPGEKTVDMAGAIREPIISVDVNTTGNALVLNPYELKYVITPADATATPAVAEVSSTAAIVNKTAYIQNFSETNVSVGATFTATLDTTTNKDVKLLTAPATKASTTKDIFLFFDIKAVDAKDEAVTWGEYDKAAATQLAYSAKGTTKANLVVLAKAATPADAATPTNTPAVAAAKGVAAFHIGGTANGQASALWTTDDTVSASVVFTFTPTVAAAA